MRICSFMLFGLLLLLAPAAPAQQPAAPPAGQPIDPVANLPHELLDQWGVKCYEYLENRSQRMPSTAGVVTVFRPHRLAVVLTSTWLDDGQVHILDDWPHRRQVRRLQERVYAAQDNFLTINRLHMLTLQHHIVGVREDDVLNYTIDGAPGSVALPPKTASLPTFMRLVTLLPMEADRQFDTRDWLDTAELQLTEQSLPIVCHGPETLYLRGIEHDTTRYTYGGYTAWVRIHDRVLLRLEMPGHRYLELLKDGNCCSAERLRDFIDQVRENAGEDVTQPAAPAAPAAPPPTAPADESSPF